MIALPTFLVSDGMEASVEDGRFVIEGSGIRLALSPHAAMATAQEIIRAWREWDETLPQRQNAAVLPFGHEQREG